MSRILGVDIGGTYTKYGFLNDKKELVSLKVVLTKEIKDYYVFLMNLAKEHESLEYISIGIPGIVKDNIILSCPNAKSLETDDFISKIERTTKIKIFVNKDVNLLFRFDLERLNLKNEDNVLGFYLGTGFGNAIKINGQLIKGSNGFAGEIGHIPVPENREICGCGKTGCTETIISGKALIRIFEENKLEGIFEDVFILYASNEKIQNFVKLFATYIVTEMIILDIQTVIISGGVVNMKGFPKDALVHQIKKSMRNSNMEEKLNIYFVDSAPENGVWGAALIMEEN